ncbi:transmembrane protein 214-B [Trichonephila inaurata madagascariensis]|uniref:Transmembrane protein 214-B n=1 Tax=Trichonephila inaurata madagascariensis TaxID=2747483 RepID=A0A8X6X5J4_9ARAC|nr:transmembrane protein 214-B [Trichonephila inaurata madagascariensis]
MAGGQWEVVGGKAKKSKAKGPANKSVPKEKNKETEDSVLGPITESHTMFYALLEEERNAALKTKVNGNEASKAPEKKVQKKKKAEKKPVAPKLTLEGAFATISEEEMKNHLATLEVLCPNNPILWLKDLTQHLNIKLDVSVEDLTFASKPLGYPSTMLNKKVYKLLFGVINRCSSQVLQLFYDFCLQNMVQDILKGLHTLGYRVMLQIIANEMPSVALENLPKCLEYCTSHQNRQNICFSILWAAGQAGNNNLEAGFKVWMNLMFPLIGTKNCTSYAVEYLEKLISVADVTKCDKSLLDVRDLFPVLDFIYSKELVKSVQKRLIAVYPTLKTLSYGPDPEIVLRNYFPSYLRRLEPHCPQPLKEEVLNSLVHCLEQDARCYSIWRQLYTKHFIQSKLLISHLNDHFDRMPAKFPKRLLRDTLSAFQVTNEEILNSTKKNVQDIEECIQINKELITKLNAGAFSWPRFLLFLILIISSALTFDILLNGSFKESYTGKFMKDTGLLVVCVQAGEKLKYFYSKVLKLSEKYFPVITAWCKETLLPFLDICFKKLSASLVFLWDSTIEIRTWCNHTLPPVLTVVEKQFVLYGSVFWNMAKSSAVLLSKMTLSALTYVFNSADSFATWIQSSPEIMQGLGTIKSFSISLVENLQRNAIYLFQLVKSYIPLFAT